MRKINNDEVRYFAPQQIAFETKSHNLKGRIYSDGFRATCDTGALPSRLDRRAVRERPAGGPRHHLHPVLSKSP